MFLQKKRTPLQATRLFTDRTATDSRLSPALGTIQALGREEEAEKVKPYLVKKEESVFDSIDFTNLDAQ